MLGKLIEEVAKTPAKLLEEAAALPGQMVGGAVKGVSKGQEAIADALEED